MLNAEGIAFKISFEGPVASGHAYAEVTIYASGDTFEALNKLGEELRFVLITSGANVENTDNKPADAVEADGASGVWLSVKASDAEKCVRCWHHQASVGSNADHPELCSRCIENIDGEGEARHYA